MFTSLILNRRKRIVLLFVLDNLFVESNYYLRSSTLFAGHVDHGPVCHKYDCVIFVRVIVVSAYQASLALRLNIVLVFI
jgi:hypothetical protein